jgi:hypothetical protein
MNPGEGGASEPDRAPPLRYRVAFFLTGLVVLSIVVTLPFSLKSVVDDLFGPATGRVVKLTRASATGTIGFSSWPSPPTTWTRTACPRPPA